ncbi:hypothetical protein AU509_13130 [Lonsdalea britannica]|uniref:Uncharacterized protein n=1 Tax=Lonsdalea britannica TaxID=1082704 RepID=A0AAD0WJK5_9GAMM|nr:hypothetical protein CKQ53_01530 [Lonsdalea britannica]OSM95479.1 hypothetical protein AU509_13130 [Lonsdalea britannica]
MPIMRLRGEVNSGEKKAQAILEIRLFSDETEKIIAQNGKHRAERWPRHVAPMRSNSTILVLNISSSLSATGMDAT